MDGTSVADGAQEVEGADGSAWPHWHELLDVRKPRLAGTWMTTALEAGPRPHAAPVADEPGPTIHERHALNLALHGAGSMPRNDGQARREWPAVDLERPRLRRAARANERDAAPPSPDGEPPEPRRD
jgi:hypothetical protein